MGVFGGITSVILTTIVGIALIPAIVLLSMTVLVLVLLVILVPIACVINIIQVIITRRNPSRSSIMYSEEEDDKDTI